MTIADFTAAIEAAMQIGPERQKKLIEDAPWMTAEEREFVANEVGATVETIKKNNEQIAADLDKIEAAIETFSKEELPKLAKEQEHSELEMDEEAAKKLLEDL